MESFVNSWEDMLNLLLKLLLDGSASQTEQYLAE